MLRAVNEIRQHDGTLKLGKGVGIQYVGDAAGHIYYWVVENNTNPYNIGVPLWTDILLPIVMWALYAWSWHSNGDAVPKGQP